MSSHIPSAAYNDIFMPLNSLEHHYTSTKDSTLLIESILELTEVITNKTDDHWEACFMMGVPPLLTKILFDEETYYREELCSHIFNLFTLIISRVCDREESMTRLKRSPSKELVGLGNDLLARFNRLRSLIVAQNSEFPQSGVSFVKFIRAYYNFCASKNRYSELKIVPVNSLVMYTWVHRVNHVADDATLHIINELSKDWSTVGRTTFCCTMMLDCGGPDVIAQRFKQELQRPDLCSEDFGACLRVLRHFGEKPQADCFIPALVRCDMLKTLYESLSTHVTGDHQEWMAIHKLATLLRALFTKSVEMTSPKTYKHIEYPLAFMSRAATLGPQHDSIDGVCTDHWVPFCDTICQHVLKFRQGSPKRVFMEEAIRHYLQPTIDSLNTYRSENPESHINNNYNWTKTMNAWIKLGKVLTSR
ncbi:hypothetical protein DENSPDRAFT_692655 [Dentipellis sp. KUC8613]|nr:hypothetical protein DENSPDRAFT_692655 [Dentipellis sp. KUC8613]